MKLKKKVKTVEQNKDIVEISEKFEDFLFEMMSNHPNVSFGETVAIVFARIVAISQLTNEEEVILRLLPAMEKSIMDKLVPDDHPVH